MHSDVKLQKQRKVPFSKCSQGTGSFFLLRMVTFSGWCSHIRAFWNEYHAFKSRNFLLSFTMPWLGCQSVSTGWKSMIWRCLQWLWLHGYNHDWHVKDNTPPAVQFIDHVWLKGYTFSIYCKWILEKKVFFLILLSTKLLTQCDGWHCVLKFHNAENVLIINMSFLRAETWNM